MSMYDWNFRFVNSELKELRTSCAGLLVPAGAVNVSTDSRLMPLVSLLQYLLKRKTARSTLEELKLFKDSIMGDAYRALCMVERCRLLYTSLSEPLVRLHASSSDKTRFRYVLWILQWMELYKANRAEEVAKYQSVSMFNKLMEVESPTRIAPFSILWNTSLELKSLFGYNQVYWNIGQLCPFGTPHNRVIRYFRRCQRIGNLIEMARVSQCFLMFKKGCPPASDNFISTALQKHRVALTTQRPRLDIFSYIDPWKGECTVIPRCALKQRIRDVISLVFRNYRHPTVYREPSKSASSHSTRSDGGQLSELRFRFHSCYGSKSVFCCFDHWDFHDTGYSVIKVPRNIEWIPIPEFSPTPSILALPVALTEPLKVRVITKEDSWSTYALSGAQRSLWKCLKSFPWFRLTGRPVDVLDLPSGVDPWISVDYSSATDNLSSEFSQLVCGVLCAQTGLPFRLCCDSLIHHKLHYEGDRLPVDQLNGQLMGSILSFIVLCICNAVVISMSISPERFDPSIDILVNGDDGLFRGNVQVFDRWKAIADWVGLSPSVGKVYFKQNFCVINSEMFVHQDGVNYHVPYPNASGMMQFDARTYSRAKGPLDLGDSLRLWLSGFSIPEEKELAEKLWFSTFDKLIRFKPINGEFVPNWVTELSINYYVPKTLGGLGFPITNSSFKPISRLALARCRYSIHEGYMFPCKRKGKLCNPFLENKQWTKLVCCVERTSDLERLSRVLGFHGEIEEVRDESIDDTHKYLRDLNPSLSTVSLSLLNDVSLGEAAACLETTDEIDFSHFRRLNRDKRFQHYWNHYDNDVYPCDLQNLRVLEGSRKLSVWEPKYFCSFRSIDCMTSCQYVNLLNHIQDQRLNPSLETILFREASSASFQWNMACFHSVCSKQSR